MEHLYVFVERLYGPEVREVLRTLYESKQELTEDQLGEKLGVRPNDVRRALNRLLEAGLVVYRRQRDPDTGKPVYYWRLNFENIRNLLVARKKLVIERLRTRLEYEQENVFFICPNDGLRFTLDEAMEYDMIRPRCGTPLEPDELRDAIIEVLEEVISALEKEVAREEARRK